MSRNSKSKVKTDKPVARKRKPIKDLAAKDVKQVKGGYTPYPQQYDYARNAKI